TGIRHKAPPDAEFGTPRGWLYATDRLLPAYRHTEKDAVARLEAKFRRLLRWMIKRNALKGKQARFLDKSQLYTIKVPFLHALLADTGPKFILVARNPYALCYRSALGKAYSLKRLEPRYGFEQRLELAAQHWGNSMQCALEDLRALRTGLIVRFEDILPEPERMMERICEFAELDFDPDMVPQPEHRIPLGNRFRERWYPLNPNVNEHYLGEIKDRHIEIVCKYCEPYASELGYEQPRI
ncbi:MAG: sulfotransferase, partial [Desulfohalobiaceae bacterium]|nr:sulfotransferase [Desulfohalobiaceae bacterium]